MELPFVPYPQRCGLLVAACSVSASTPVILQTPAGEPRLLKAARALFASVEERTGPFALYSAGSIAPYYPMGRAQGYLLCLREQAVQLAADDAPGLYYGMQTLGQWLEMPQRPALEIVDWPDLEMRSDYLDMRGLFPRFDKLLGYVREMGRYKLNTLVVEYEDKLPRARPELCAAEGTLTREQHAQLLETARDNFIEIIPLQQSFGHLEYALKLPEYQYLRETPDNPGEMCPLREGAFELAAALIEETAALHPDSRYLHLGCDEVWSLGQSPECQADGRPRGQIAVEFINRLAEKVLALGKTPILWHDMFASGWVGHTMIPTEDYSLLEALHKEIVVAIWLYSPELVNGVAPKVVEGLNAQGIRVIPCSAVRAGDNCADQNYPRVEQRLRNIDAWCEFIGQSRCTGMINTNWCSTFALGNPYGLFETSRYTAFYAADRCWNLAADSTGYLERFLAAYHGVYDAQIISGPERRYDYYRFIGGLLPRVTRNRETARLIEIMWRLDYATPVNHTLFRGELFPDSEVELACLRERSQIGYAKLREIEQDLRPLLPELLSPAMADLFLESRLYPNRLFKREFERILGISLD